MISGQKLFRETLSIISGALLCDVITHYILKSHSWHGLIHSVELTSSGNRKSGGRGGNGKGLSTPRITTTKITIQIQSQKVFLQPTNNNDNSSWILPCYIRTVKACHSASGGRVTGSIPSSSRVWSRTLSSQWLPTLGNQCMNVCEWVCSSQSSHSMFTISV